ncbi:hypothetical protein [Aeromicrobium sp. UC242_57]|uniref:hypothetical protein n=1 Tax=Aeromicrobium sp. UC242_57 TaxID=3374624 RepID=UPI0037AE18E2
MIYSVLPTELTTMVCGLALASVCLAAPLSSPAGASESVEIQRDPPRSVSSSSGRPARSPTSTPVWPGRSKSASADKAEDWLAEQAALFGVSPDDLVLAGNESSDHGRTLTYTQQHGGVPVFGAALKVNLDTHGALTSVNGHVVPDLDLTTQPGVSAAKAEAAAIRQVRQDPPTSEDGKLASADRATATSTLVIYRPARCWDEAEPPTSPGRSR